MESAHHVAGGPVRMVDPEPVGYRRQNRGLTRAVDVLYARVRGGEERRVHARLDEGRNEDLELPRLADKLGQLVGQGGRVFAMQAGLRRGPSGCNGTVRVGLWQARVGFRRWP